MSHGSLMKLQKRRIGIRATSAMGISTKMMKTASVPYSVATSRARLFSTPSPLVPTVTAMAAPMPNGANAITSPVNLNITWLSDSQKSSITCLGRPCTRESPTANRMAKNTICSTSLCVAASKKLCGTMCSMTPANVIFVCASSAALSVLAPARLMPAPGLTRFTAPRPRKSAMVVTISK